MRSPRPRWLAATALASCLLAPGSADAQAGLPQLEDATLAPRGVLRLRAITAWTRFDTRFTDAGVEPVGARFTRDSLGAGSLPTLTPAQALVQSASASPFTLSIGRSRLDARVREEVVPLGLEYGVTNRLTVGVVVPVVRRRIAVQFRLDSAGANVGPNLLRTSTAARQNNAQVQTEFANARAQLQARAQFCQSNPGAPSCASFDQAAATQVLAASQTFAADVGNLYGTSTGDGMPFVPLATSDAQLAIAARVAGFNAQFRSLLGASTDLVVAVPRGAAGPVGSAELQEYRTDEVGADSISSEERSGIGDVEVHVKALLVDRRPTTQRSLGMQLVVAAGARLPTGSRDSPSEFADLTLGAGSPAVEARAALDLTFGRFGLLAVGDGWTTVAATEDVAVGAESQVFGLHLAPRWYVSAPLSFHAAYSLRQGDGPGTTQLVGGGVSVSTLPAFRAGGGPLPFEMRFTHLEAISGPAGTPKFFRDQLELRLYYRLFGR